VANNARCVILVPFANFIAPQCEMALDELERRGYPVTRVRGYASIELARNQMATDALAAGYDETFWIDADMDFHPDTIDQLRSHNLPITCGVYARRNARALAVQALPEATSLSVGKGTGLCEILYAATGFFHVRQVVYDTIQRQLRLPVCNVQFRRPLVPYFQAMIRECDDGHWYLSEDYAFCERARQCGFKIMADTSIRLWHLGEYPYGWEDAGLEWPRYESFTFEAAADTPKEI
jgi:hypothetical protein